MISPKIPGSALAFIALFFLILATNAHGAKIDSGSVGFRMGGSEPRLNGDFDVELDSTRFLGFTAGGRAGRFSFDLATDFFNTQLATEVHQTFRTPDLTPHRFDRFETDFKVSRFLFSAYVHFFKEHRVFDPYIGFGFGPYFFDPEDTRTLSGRPFKVEMHNTFVTEIKIGADVHIGRWVSIGAQIRRVSGDTDIRIIDLGGTASPVQETHEIKSVEFTWITKVHFGR
ncbi:MAG TPA: hypothetical protein VIU33_05785 [Nitrospiria bacterium]